MLRKLILLEQINFGCLMIALLAFLMCILILSGFVILGVLKYFIFGG